MRKILVTGGAGFIGSNFVRFLLNKGGYRVVVLDKLSYAGNLGNFSREILSSNHFRFVKGDICDRQTVRALYRAVDAVVHLAAETHIDRSIDDLDPFIQTDVVGSAVLLDEFRRNPRERFIHISTSEVYGSARTVPMAEDHPLEPQSPYAASKAAADRLAYSFFRTYNLPITIIRPFNNYGPHQHPEKLIPFAITSALDERPILVYGTGKNTRDWLHVDDTCALLERFLTLPIGKIKGEVVNLGTGRETDVLEIARTILRRLGKKANGFRHIADRPGHVERLVASTKKMEALAGMKPATGFPAGLERTVDWYAHNERWWRHLLARKAHRTFSGRWYRNLR